MAVARGEGREALLSAMRTVALSKGFPASTVDEVCAVAGVSKGSFYHHFASKEEICLASLDSYFDDILVALSATDLATGCAETDLRNFIANAKEVGAGQFLKEGCLLGSAAFVLADRQPEVQQRLDTIFGALRDLVADLIDKAAKQRGVNIASRALGNQFLAVLEGGIVLTKSYRTDEAMIGGLDLFESHLMLLLDS